MSRPATRSAQQGFGLIEVMVSLVIIAVGLLGIEKMEALAYASTGVASGRSLAAIEAESLAAAMHANRAYWGAWLAPASFTVLSNAPAAGVTVTDATNVLNQAAACSTASGAASTPASCSPAVMAAFDVQQWGNALNTLLPNAAAQVTCSTALTSPVNCTITISWSETSVAVNTQGTLAQQGPSYTLYVEP